jgi:hypothetical protein
MYSLLLLHANIETLRSKSKNRPDSPRREAIIQRRRIHPQHHHKVDPALGEQVARVPVYYAAALLGLVLDGVKQLCFVLVTVHK